MVERASRATRYATACSQGPSEVSNSKRRGFLDQNQERRLKSIFGRVLIAQDASADALDERTMPLDENSKGRLRRGFVVRHESLEQLCIGQPTERPPSNKTRSNRSAAPDRPMITALLPPGPRLVLHQ